MADVTDADRAKAHGLADGSGVCNHRDYPHSALCDKIAAAIAEQRESDARIADRVLARLVEIQTKSSDVNAACDASTRQIVAEHIATAIRAGGSR